MTPCDLEKGSGWECAGGLAGATVTGSWTAQWGGLGKARVMVRACAYESAMAMAVRPCLWEWLCVSAWAGVSASAWVWACLSVWVWVWVSAWACQSAWEWACGSA